MAGNKETKTVQEWVEEVLSSKEKMNNWLTRQYVGEVLASHRISSLAFTVTDPEHSNVLSIIAEDEHRHAQWVKELLINRGIEIPEPTYDADRYWSKILSDDLTETQLFAAGAHADWHGTFNSDDKAFADHLEKFSDPEYQEFLRLKEKFNG